MGGGRRKCEIRGVSTKKPTPDRGLGGFDVSLLYNSCMNVPLCISYTKGLSHRFVYKMQSNTRRLVTQDQRDT